MTETTVPVVGDKAGVSVVVEVVLVLSVTPLIMLVRPFARSGPSKPLNLNDTEVLLVLLVLDVSVLVDVVATKVEVTTTVGVVMEVNVLAASVEVTVRTGVEREVGSDGVTTTVVVDGAGGVTVR